MAAIQAAQNRADIVLKRNKHDERVAEVRIFREEMGRIREDLSAQPAALRVVPGTDRTEGRAPYRSWVGSFLSHAVG